MVHAGRLTPYQQAQLFTGGLSDHIRIDVELHDPQDLQCTMALARAYERRDPAPVHALPTPSARPPRRNLGVCHEHGRDSTGRDAPAASIQATHPGRDADCRKLGLCYNCDEPYVRGHKCPHLFYLEVTDYVVEELEDDAPDNTAAAATAEPVGLRPSIPRRR
jgi:hypothetical protein